LSSRTTFALAHIAGVYGIADTHACNGDPERGAAQLIEGGCRLIQLRAKDWSEDDILRAGRNIAAQCSGTGTTFVLNDHAHLVAACGASGLHLGQGDQSPTLARRVVGPNILIGLSTNSLENLHHIDPQADYLAFGPVWDSMHAGAHKHTQGLEQLIQARQLLSSNLPLVAIGGIQADAIPVLQEFNIQAWAVIGAIFNTPDPVAATKSFIPKRVNS